MQQNDVLTAILAALISGSFVLISKKSKLEERLGIPDDSWQQWVFVFVAIFLAVLLARAVAELISRT